MRLQVISPLSVRTYRLPGAIVLALAAALAVGLVAGCSTAGPVKQSRATMPKDVPIQDQARYNKARALVNQGNQAFVKAQYARALELADQSLAAHDNFGAHFLKGSALFRLGRNLESLDSFYKAENIRSLDEQLLLTIAVVQLARGDVGRAQERYLRLQENYPKEPVYAYKVGTTYKLMGQYEKAYEALKKADVAGFEHLAQLYVQLGDTTLELKRYKESEEYFAKAHKLDPKLKAAGAGTRATSVARILDQGNEAFKAGKYPEALAHFNRAKEKSPRSAGPYLLAGTVQLALNKPDLAIEDLKKGVNLNPGNPRGYSLLGSAFHQAGRYLDAQTTLQTGLKVAPESAELYNKLGLVQKDNDQLRSAIDSFQHAVRLKADFAPARVNLAFALLDDKRFSEAQVQFEEAAKINPNDESLKEGRALVQVYSLVEEGDRFFRQGAIDRAVASYKKALDIREAAVVYNALGAAELSRKNRKAAIDYYEQSRKKDPKNVAAIQGLLRAHSDRASAGKRRALLAELRRLTGNDINVGISLGLVEEEQGRLKKAEGIYQALLKKNPGNDLLKRRLGYVYYRLGLRDNKAQKFEPALAHLKKAGEFNADIPQLPASLRVVEENIRFKDQLPTLRRAEQLYDRQQYAGALPLYEKVYEKLQRPLILVKIANCHIALGRESKGLRILEEARRVPSQNIAISEAIYTYMLKKGRTEEAQRGFALIVRSHPGAYYSHYKLGIIDLLSGQLDSALEHFGRAVTYRPDFVAAYVARGVVHYRRGDADKARAQFELAVTREPKSPLAAFNLGVMSYNDNLTDKAEEAFRSLALAQPEFTDARYHLSYIHYSRGDLDKALEELRAIIAIDAQPRYRFAVAQVLEKRYETARTPANAAALRAAYEELISKHPGSSYASESRKKMHRLNPDERVLHAYPQSAKAFPLLTNGVLVQRDRNSVAAFDSQSKARLWVREYDGAVQAVFAAGAVFALADGRLELLNHRAGIVLKSFEAPPGAVQILGDYSTPALVSKDKKQVRLTVFGGSKPRETTAVAGSEFHFAGGNFYLLRPAGKGRELLRLGTDLQTTGSPIAIAGKRARLTLLRVGERLYAFLAGRALWVIKDDEASKSAVARDERRLLHAGGADGPILVVGSSTARALKPDGDTAARFRLPVAVRDGASVVATAGNRIAYVGVDGKLHHVLLTEGDAKSIWVQDLGDLPKASGVAGRTFSVYH